MNPDFSYRCGVDPVSWTSVIPGRVLSVRILLGAGPHAESAE